MQTATTKDVSSIMNRVNQLIAMQHKQKETLVHIISVLNVTRYDAEVKRQYINLVIDAVERTHQDFTFTLHQPKLPTNCTSHLLHSGKPQRLTILYETSCYACNGLYRYSYNWYTITSCSPSRRSLENVNFTSTDTCTPTF